MATVIPTTDAQAELVRAYHLDFEAHPAAKRQVFEMRQVCCWRGMNRDVTNFEKPIQLDRPQGYFAGRGAWEVFGIYLERG